MIKIKKDKWIVVDDKGRFLSQNGFKSFDSPTAIPHLFQSVRHAKNYMKRDHYILCDNLKYIQVDVNIEEKEVANYED